MEAAVKEQVRKIVSDAIKLNDNVEYLYSVEAFTDLYGEELSKISDLASGLQNTLMPLLGYIEADNIHEQLKNSGELKEYGKTPH
jgi:hypothetical protein